VNVVVWYLYALARKIFVTSCFFAKERDNRSIQCHVIIMSTTPSFSSFPSFESFPQSDSGPNETHEEKEKNNSTPTTKKRRPSRERSHKHKKRRPVHHDDRDLLLNERREDPTIFYADSKGNRNAHYGAPDPANIPKYQLAACTYQRCASGCF
jgi:hypothetical protein